MLTPRIVVELNHQRIADAEERDEDAGVAMAKALRAMADLVEKDINIIPYGNGEWVTEHYDFRDEEGPLGSLELRED